MSGAGIQVPKPRQLQPKKQSMVAVLDIGSSKIACMIARLKPCAPSDALRGRSHAIELIGYSQIQSRGVKAGAVVDLNACEQAVRHAVTLSERMAGVHVDSVLLSVSAGRLHGQLVEACADIRGGSVSQGDVMRVTSTGMHHATPEGRSAVHVLPMSYSLDGVKGIRDPRGMVARSFGVEMNIVTAEATAVRNLMLVVERCHLDVEAVAASPYLAGISVLTADDTDVGAAVVDLGAGTTTLAIFRGGHFVHAAGFAIGGQHITMDLARGIGTCIAEAERIKTLYGTVLVGGSDARDLMQVPAAADSARDAPQSVSRATVTNIIRQRAEEIFEMVRDRLADSPFASEPRAGIVLTGGGSQLTGIADLASDILKRNVRIGRPLGFGRLPVEAKSASFAVPTGLLAYPQYGHLEHVEPRHPRQLLKTGTGGGYFGKVGQWLKEGF